MSQGPAFPDYGGTPLGGSDQQAGQPPAQPPPSTGVGSASTPDTQPQIQQLEGGKLPYKTYDSLLRLEALQQLPPDKQAALNQLRKVGAVPDLQIWNHDNPFFRISEQRWGLLPYSLRAIAEQESPFPNAEYGSYDPQAVSPTGARGIMQFTRETGKRYGLNEDNFWNPYLQIEAAGHLMSDNLRQSAGDLQAAYALYGNHKQLDYAPRVMRHQATYNRVFGPEGEGGGGGGGTPQGQKDTNQPGAQQSPTEPLPGATPRPGEPQVSPGTPATGDMPSGEPPMPPPDFPAEVAPRTFGESFTQRGPAPEPLMSKVRRLVKSEDPFMAPQIMTGEAGTIPGRLAGAGAETASGSRDVGDVAQIVADYAPLIYGVGKGAITGMQGLYDSMSPAANARRIMRVSAEHQGNIADAVNILEERTNTAIDTLGQRAARTGVGARAAMQDALAQLNTPQTAQLRQSLIDMENLHPNHIRVIAEHGPPAPPMSAIPDPMGATRAAHQQNYAQFVHARNVSDRYMTIFDRAAQATNPNQRTALLQQAQRIAQSHGSTIPEIDSVMEAQRNFTALQNTQAPNITPQVQQTATRTLGQSVRGVAGTAAKKAVGTAAWTGAARAMWKIWAGMGL